MRVCEKESERECVCVYARKHAYTRTVRYVCVCEKERARENACVYMHENTHTHAHTGTRARTHLLMHALKFLASSHVIFVAFSCSLDDDDV